MKTIPNDIWEQFFAVLKKRAIPVSSHADYRKWLQYFLDFGSKYPVPEPKSEQVRLFIQKLQEKKQNPEQQKQAAHALSLFFESQHVETKAATISTSSQYRATTEGLPLQVSGTAITPAGPANHNSPYPPLILRGGGEAGGVTTKGESSNNLSRAETAQRSSSRPSVPSLPAGNRFNEWRCLKKSASPAWDKIIESLAAEIKMRHYSRKTLKTYADWSRKFQSYLHSKSPDELSATDVKSYLTYLAVNCKVAASTQNQAFNALLFLYRHILKKDFGEHKDIPRAKRSNYIPVVLSRQEIDSVLKHLPHPYNLIVKLLYGCGLRLFEGVKLRVKDFNFDAGVLTV